MKVGAKTGILHSGNAGSTEAARSRIGSWTSMTFSGNMHKAVNLAVLLIKSNWSYLDIGCIEPCSSSLKLWLGLALQEMTSMSICVYLFAVLLLALPSSLISANVEEGKLHGVSCIGRIGVLLCCPGTQGNSREDVISHDGRA